MANRRYLVILVVGLAGAMGATAVQAIPAFPGAEGAGANATGGRPKIIGEVLQGTVYHVTTLAADPTGTIPGSLRYGMRDENFRAQALPQYGIEIDPDQPFTYDIKPRTIVFDVGGTIVLDNTSGSSDIDMTPRNFTLAGQTAPGGITIYGAEFNPGHRIGWDTDGSWTNTNNLIIRNLSVRTHNANEKDGFWVPLSNSIVDHVSASWYTDEGVSITDGARDITVQHSIVGPGWINPDGDGSQIEGSTPEANISVHHNLYINNDARIPRVGEKEGPGVELDFRNNVIYNWNDSKAGYSTTSSGLHEPSFSNFVNNYYIGGSDTDNNDVIFNTGNNATRIYQSGNLLDRNFDGVANGTIGTDPAGWQYFTGSEIQQATPYAVPHGVTQTPDETLSTVSNYGGANWWSRHFLDTRAISQLGTLGNIALPVADRGQVLTTSAAHVAALAADAAIVTSAPMQTRLAGYDTDNDGMPNEWEEKHGLDPNSLPASPDWIQDYDGDGYINVEEYINEIAEWPAPYEIVFTGGTNSRFEQITNWSITRSSPGEADTTTNWQPSQFDAAVINNGTVSMNSVGQHAGKIRLASGATDNATLNITDGWLEVEDEAYGLGNGEVVIGAHASATAALNLSGGELTVKTLSKGAGGTFNFTGGVLSAETVGFTLVNNGGTIAPGASPGLTHVVGDLTLNSGVLEIEIGSTNPLDYDKLAVDGATALGGTLQVKLIDPLGGTNEFVPALDDQFAFLVTGSLSDPTFDAFDYPELPEGLEWELTTGTTTFLTVVAADTGLDGDFNDDGFVDAADYTVWRNHFGEADETNLHFNGDGNDVGESDYLVWTAHYGEADVPAGGGGIVGNVPEPGTFVLLLVGVVALGCGRRSSR